MVEYYGWININQSVDGENEEDIRLTVKELEHQLHAIDFPERILTVKVINGNFVFNASGVCNHFSQDVEDVFEIYRVIAAKAPGSYGLLYIRNDEDRGRDNEFVVWRLARGAFSSFRDRYLSPCNPVIED